MRDTREQDLALECLKLAHHTCDDQLGWELVIRRAERYFAFITGTEPEDALADKLAKVREAIYAARLPPDCQGRAGW